MQAFVAQATAQLSPGETAVISSEILSGHPFYGGRESEVYAERLKRVAPNAKILISIRNQMQILPSVYMQYVLRGGTMPPEQFFQGTEEPGYFAFAPEHFEYDLLVRHYQNLFGAMNVYILTQESLQRDMADATARLAAFAGNTRFAGLAPAEQRPVGISYPEYAIPILRRINHIQRSQINPRPIVSVGMTPRGLYKLAGYMLKVPFLTRRFKGRKPVSDHVRKRFANRYADSNLRLAELVAHPLDLSGYDGVAQ